MGYMCVPWLIVLVSASGINEFVLGVDFGSYVALVLFSLAQTLEGAHIDDFVR
jgi:hypothetical protein